MKVAIFARYSSVMQDAMSIDAQVNEMEGHCAKQGWSISHRFLLPETASHELSTDPQFQAMLAAGQRREFDILLVHALDRLGRDLATTVQAKTILRRAGVKVTSVRENLGDSIQDILIENVLSAIGQYYSQNLGQETKKGHRQLTRVGLWKGGTPPFGYVPRKVEGNHTRLELHPEQAQIMREVFEAVARGDRTADILDWLESSTGERWSYPTLYGRIKNPIYYGCVQYGRTSLSHGRRVKHSPDEVVEGSIEGLVTKELWDEANQRILQRASKRPQGRAPKRLYLLSEGVCTCSACGRPLVGNSTHQVGRYTCSGRRDKGCSVRAGVDAAELESAIHKVFVEEMARFDVESFISDYEASLRPQLAEAKRREGRLRKALSEVRVKLNNLAKALADGCDFSSVRNLMEGLQNEENVIADEIGRCQLVAEKNVKENVALVRQYVASLGDLMPEMTPEELKEFYLRNLRVEWDLEKQEGQLCLKLAPSDRREVVLPSRKHVGRSARI